MNVRTYTIEELKELYQEYWIYWCCSEDEDKQYEWFDNIEQFIEWLELKQKD